MPADYWFWCIALIAVLYAGIAKGGFGGGPAMLATPILALGSDPVTAAALMLPVLCFIDLFSLKEWWRDANWQDLKLLLPGAVMGILLGALLFESLNVAVLLLLTGGLALGLSVWQFTGGARVRHPKPWVGRLCGFLAGASSTVAHAGGPPVSLYLLSKKIPSSVYLGTTTVFFTVTNALKLIPYTMLDLLPTVNLMTSFSLMPLAWIGIKLGIWMHHRISQALFYRVAYSFLAIVGIVLIIRGISSL